MVSIYKIIKFTCKKKFITVFIAMRDLLFNVYKIGTSHTCITCADPDYFIGRVVNPIRGEIVFVGEGLEVGSRPFFG